MCGLFFIDAALQEAMLSYIVTWWIQFKTYIYIFIYIYTHIFTVYILYYVHVCFVSLGKSVVESW